MPQLSKESVVINLIPNSKKYIDHPQIFDKTDQLYLELIENKIKIKQELVNKDWKRQTHTKTQLQPLQEQHISPKSETSTISSKKSIDESLPNSQKESPITPKLKTPMSPLTPLSPKSPLSPKLKTPKSATTPTTSMKNSPHHNEFEKTTPKKVISKETTPEKEIDELSVNSKMDHMNLSNKLQNLLSQGVGGYTNKYSKERNVTNKFEDYKRSRTKTLPTLTELEQQGMAKVRKEYPDVSRITTEDEDLKREMLFKFDLLRKSYKEQNIPEYSIHSDLDMMRKSYDDTVRRLSLDNSVENYKKYMIGAFMVIEYALGKWLHFDMEGYTQQQIISMSTYEKLLIEIGEKSYVPSGKKWSVEVRLLFLVIINTAFFIVGKMIMKNTGSNILNAINNMNRANQNTTPGVSKSTTTDTKKKMKGPDINLDDLPDINTM